MTYIESSSQDVPLNLMYNDIESIVAYIRKIYDTNNRFAQYLQEQIDTEDYDDEDRDDIYEKLAVCKVATERYAQQLELLKPIYESNNKHPNIFLDLSTSINWDQYTLMSL